MPAQAWGNKLHHQPADEHMACCLGHPEYALAIHLHPDQLINRCVADMGSRQLSTRIQQTCPNRHTGTAEHQAKSNISNIRTAESLLQASRKRKGHPGKSCNAVVWRRVGPQIKTCRYLEDCEMWCLKENAHQGRL